MTKSRVSPSLLRFLPLLTSSSNANLRLLHHFNCSIRRFRQRSVHSQVFVELSVIIHAGNNGKGNVRPSDRGSWNATRLSFLESLVFRIQLHDAADFNVLLGSRHGCLANAIMFARCEVQCERCCRMGLCLQLQQGFSCELSLPPGSTRFVSKRSSDCNDVILYRYDKFCVARKAAVPRR
jgi:hypothetical protein